MEDSHCSLSRGKNPLDEWRRGTVHLFPWLGVLVRRVLAIPAPSAASEGLFSTAGTVMTKKRLRLTCDNMEDLVYLERYIYLHICIPHKNSTTCVPKL